MNKKIITHIYEALKINSKSKAIKTYCPKTKNELRDIINQRIESEGNKCDLNDINVSEIKDMSELFYGSKFNGDISNWDVSKVKYMSSMFWGSKFSGDLSKWNVSNVEDMSGMFMDSEFNQDISNWDVSNLKNDFDIFENCPIEEKYKPNFKKEKKENLKILLIFYHCFNLVFN